MSYWIITTRQIEQVQKRLRNQRLIGKQTQSENSSLSSWITLRFCLQVNQWFFPKKKLKVNLMEFCNDCGSRLVPKKVNSGKQAVLMLVCTKCQYKKWDNVEDVKSTGKIIEHSPKQFVAIIGKEEQKLSTLPTVRIQCPRCGNKTANVWQVQTRGSDESSTQFLRCTECNYTFREYT